MRDLFIRNFEVKSVYTNMQLAYSNFIPCHVSLSSSYLFEFRI